MLPIIIITESKGSGKNAPNAKWTMAVANKINVIILYP
jgi:hypothetical protein